jgi:sugar (pentulose or hexulose) kinase
MTAVVGVDIGTSSTKSVLVAADGEVLASARAEYPMYRPHPGWAENDPEDWVAAVRSTVRSVMADGGIPADRVRALCIVGQRDPGVMLDEAGRPLGRAISWIDLRGREEAADLYGGLGVDRLIATTGLVPIPGLTLPNLAWVRRHQRELFQRMRRVLAPKDYVLFRLTGRIATDTSTPTRSMLYDLHGQRWSDWICEAAGIDPAILPPIEHQPWEAWGELPEDAAASLGLQAGTVVAAGGGDDPAAALGAGAIDPGDVVVGTGTASCWRIVSATARPDPGRRVDLTIHLVPGRYLYEVIITGTGTSLRWFRDLLQPESGGEPISYESLLAAAERAPLGAASLFFYPYMEGARAPLFNDNASGIFFGLRSHHDRGHLARAILEGIAFQYAPVAELLAEFGSRPTQLTLVDDEARSALWNQIKADVTGLPVATLRSRHAAALGAAILAALAAGLFRDARSAVAAFVRPDRVFAPRPGEQDRYGRIRDRYVEVLRLLEPAFGRMC